MEVKTNNSILSFALKLFRSMQKDNLGYMYRGIFNQEITDNILSLTENNLKKEEQSPKIKKRVYSIMVECLQNITRHQDETENLTSDNYGIFVIQKNKDKYYITSGNSIENKNIEPIKSLIEKINKLKKDELKQYYKEVLNEGELSDKGGAGLGLIDMARKSGNKLSYKFNHINDKNSYFYLHTIPTLDTIELINANGTTASLINIIDIHKILNEENIFLIFNGIFNQENMMSLLTTVEGQMVGPLSLKKKVFYIVVEMLQNIVNHGECRNEYQKGNPGIFFISQQDDKYLLTTGNFICNDNLEKLIKRIDHVNNLTSNQLDDYYNKCLYDFKIEKSKKSSLGIVDLRIKSNNDILYSTNRINETLSFFTIQTHVKIK